MTNAARVPAAGGVVPLRPSVIQLVFREKGALYAAYMPVFSDGGLFVPTTREYRLGEDIYLLLSLSRYSRVVGTNRPPSENTGM